MFQKLRKSFVGGFVRDYINEHKSILELICFLLKKLNFKPLFIIISYLQQDNFRELNNLIVDIVNTKSFERIYNNYKKEMKK